MGIILKSFEKTPQKEEKIEIEMHKINHKRFTNSQLKLGTELSLFNMEVSKNKIQRKYNIEGKKDPFPTVKMFESSNCSIMLGDPKCYYCDGTKGVLYYWPPINKDICNSCKKNRSMLF